MTFHSKSILFLKCLAILIFLAGLLASCEWLKGPENLSPYGYLKGNISIGPLCPDEQNPPDSSCLPTMETYRTWATAVYTGDKKTKLFTIQPDIKGNFLDSLPEGYYIIDYDTVRNPSIGGSNMPLPVIIHNRDTVKISITIDTGIR